MLISVTGKRVSLEKSELPGCSACSWVARLLYEIEKRERGGGRVRVEKLATLLGPHQMLAAGLSQERTGCLKKIMSILNEPKANKEMQFAQRKSTGTKTGEIIPKEL